MMFPLMTKTPKTGPIRWMIKKPVIGRTTTILNRGELNILTFPRMIPKTFMGQRAMKK